ncbi:uncharacterized protein LOC128875689 [Hylaeus volcanicus]|uniref:uncharacterized protein LOC128875689 n=1 Tax=Hylaeus volcanicus TaxID=313075 RepID=UPI0023B82163|nr:uncharacterized protein LOC128875689 [Hylaeus volcanicus]
METRSSDKLFILNYYEQQIVGAKLPSNGQVLRVLFYNMRKVKLDLKTSATLVIKETEIFWEKARIPVKKTSDSIDKLKSLYQKWRTLYKSVNRRTAIQIQREQEFKDSLDDLFDIAHANALEMIKIEEDKLFLLKQREKGRVGLMGASDRALAEKEKRKTLREERTKTLQEQGQQSLVQETVQLQSSSSSSDDMTMNVPLGSGIGDFPLGSSIGNVPEGLQVSSDSEVEGDSNIPGPSDRKRRGKVQVFSSKSRQTSAGNVRRN